MLATTATAAASPRRISTNKIDPRQCQITFRLPDPPVWTEALSLRSEPGPASGRNHA
jgi:hypothetical protein